MSNNYIPNNEHFLKRARNIRNELLNRTDRYFLIDYPIAYEQQLIIKTYRQELRDFININKEKILNGDKIDFPTQPSFIDLNINELSNFSSSLAVQIYCVSIIKMYKSLVKIKFKKFFSITWY